MLAMIRRTSGTILCFLYGFAVPLFAVVALALWDESRQEFGMLIAIVRRVTGELGISADVELKKHTVATTRVLPRKSCSQGRFMTKD